MSWLTFLAGVSAIIFALGFIVIPAMWSRFDYRRLPISYTGTLPKVKWFFNTGLVGAGCCQLVYVIGLLHDYNVKVLPAGLFILAVGETYIVLAGLIPLNRSIRLHSNFASSYFVLTPIGGFLIEATLLTSVPEYRTFGPVFALIALIGILYFFYFQKSAAFAALWGIFISTFWILQFYFL